MKPEDVLKIPSLFDGVKKKKEVAAELQVPVRKLDYYIKKLRDSGVEVNTRRGPKPLQINASSRTENQPQS